MIETKTMKKKRLEYCKGGMFEKQHWLVWEDEHHATQFFDFELANIYAILLDIKLGEFNLK